MPMLFGLANITKHTFIAQADSALAILTAMITPAVLISASGLLVLSTSNRLSRVVDRVRTLADKAQSMDRSAGGPDAASRALILDQLSRLSRRAMLLRAAMTSLYLAIGLFVATSISVGIVSVLNWRYGWIPVILGLVGSCALLYGSILLISEARHAVASTLQEMNFVRESVSRARE